MAGLGVRVMRQSAANWQYDARGRMLAASQSVAAVGQGLALLAVGLRPMHREDRHSPLRVHLLEALAGGEGSGGD